MSKLNIDDDNEDNNENIDYQILCDFDMSFFNGRYLGYIFVIILYLLLLFIYVNINIVFYWFFLLSFFIHKSASGQIHSFQSESFFVFLQLYLFLIRTSAKRKQ